MDIRRWLANGEDLSPRVLKQRVLTWSVLSCTDEDCFSDIWHACFIVFHSDGYGCKRRQAQMLDEQIAEKHRREALKACQLFNAVGVWTRDATSGCYWWYLARVEGKSPDIEVWVMDLGCWGSRRWGVTSLKVLRSQVVFSYLPGQSTQTRTRRGARAVTWKGTKVIWFDDHHLQTRRHLVNFLYLLFLKLMMF